MRLHLFDHGHRPHLLIVAGNASLARAVSRVAERGDFEITIAGNRSEALRMKDRLELAGYVIDAALPDADGAELVRELRDARVSAPILFLDSLAGAAARPNADAILTKPLSLPELREELREWFSNGEVAVSAPGAFRQRARSFHLYTVLVPVLLAVGIGFTWWLLNLK
jgi:DNA-binding response OmpR family regulator